MVFLTSSPAIYMQISVSPINMNKYIYLPIKSMKRKITGTVYFLWNIIQLKRILFGLFSTKFFTTETL